MQFKLLRIHYEAQDGLIFIAILLPQSPEYDSLQIFSFQFFPGKHRGHHIHCLVTQLPLALPLYSFLPESLTPDHGSPPPSHHHVEISSPLTDSVLLTMVSAVEGL